MSPLVEEESSPPGSPGPAAKKKESSAPSQPTRATAKSKGPASRGGRYYSRGGKPARDSTQDGQEETPVGDESAPKKGECQCFYFVDMYLTLLFPPNRRRGSWPW